MPMAVVAEANVERLHEDARHQVLGVAGAAGQRDGAAEHDREQQHEHDRLQDGEDGQLGDPRDALEVAPGDASGHRRRPGAAPPAGARCRRLLMVRPPRRPRRGSGGSTPRPRRPRPTWPVSDRKTSSSVGRRMPMSSTRDAGLVELAEDPEQLLGATAGRDAQVARGLVDGDVALAVTGQHGLARRGCPRARWTVDLDALAADLALQLVGGAAGDDPAVVDDGDVVGQLVGLLEVLRRQQQRRALARRAPRMTSHMPRRLRGSRPGGGLVEEQQSRSADEGAGQVEATAHAARVGLDRAVGGVDEVELLEQLVRTCVGLLGGQLVEPPEEPQVLAAGEVLVDGRVLAGEADDAAQLLRLLARRRSRPRWPVPGVGTQQGGEDADAWSSCRRRWVRAGPGRCLRGR